MANMNMRTKGPSGYLYNAPNGGVYYYPKTGVKKLPPYRYPGYTGKPVPGPRPGTPGYVPRVPRPGSLAEVQQNPGGFPILPGGGAGKVAFRIALNTFIAIAQDWGPEWAKMPSNSVPGGYVFPSGWTLFCTSCCPSSSQNVYHNAVVYAGFNPGCGNSIKAGVSQAWGTPITLPAGGSSVSEVWGKTSNAPPNPQGYTINEWVAPAGFPGGVAPYAPGTVTLPIPNALGTSQMERVPSKEQSSPQRLKPYQSPAMSLTLQPGRPPRKNPHDVHNHVPPGKNEKEDKPFDPGRSVKEVYGALTEVDDALDCMEKSLKDNKDKTHRKHVPWNKRLDLRTLRAAQEAYSGNIDWQKFVNCMRINNAKDALIGGISGTASRNLNQSPYAPRGRAYRGYGVGGGSTRMR